MRRLVALLAVIWVVFAPVAVAQDADDAYTERGPRFLVALSPAPVRMDVGRMPTLRRRISIALQRVPLLEALRIVSEKSGVHLAFSNALLPERIVEFRADNITVAAVLTELLLDAQVDILFSQDGRGVLVRRRAGAVGAGALVGRVTDAKSGQAITHADIFLEDARRQTTSDTAGWYRLTDLEAGNHTLVVRRLGYAKQSRSVTVADGRTDTVNVALEPAPTRLDELVSTATGRQRRRDIANDVTVLDVDSILRTEPIRSVTDLLETRVPGMTVQRTSGAPGDPARIRLRGASSPRQSNDPIVIVDGVRVYAEQSAARSANLATLAAASDAYAAPSPLDYIDPNSIETLEVLKGPSAATLYGQDAANGVIVITTKKGKAGPTRWTAMVDHGRTYMSRTNKYPELLVRWGHEPVTDTRVYCPLSAFYCQADSTAHGSSLLGDPAFNPIAQGHRTALTLSASGGTAALTYAVTGSFQDELGLMKLPPNAAADYEARVGTGVPDWMQRPQQFRQWGATSQLTARLGATADVSLTTQVTRERQQRSSLEQQLDFLLVTYFDPTTGTYYGGVNNGHVSLAVRDGILANYYRRVTAVATTLTNGVTLGWRPRTWLALTANAGLNLIQRGDENLTPHGASVADTGGRLNSGKGTSLVSTVNLRANATAPLGRGFVFRFAAGANYAGTSIDDQDLQTENLPRGQTLKGSTLVGANRALSDEATFGWYLEPSLGHRRFTVTTGFRIDGGSSYGSSVSLPTLPKLGFTYLVSDEPWFPMKALFQSLRFRLAYGKASRQPGITDRLRVYGETQSVWVDGDFGDGVFLQSLGNSVLRPERSTEVEGGLDADLLDNRLTLSVTGYRKTTDDALLAVPVAPSVYGDQVTQLKNIGVIRNTGLELTADARLVRSGPLSWSTQVQLSQNRNLVVRLGPGVKSFYTEGTFHEGGIRVAPGYPLFGRWVTPTVAYADANGNGVLELSEVVLGDTAVYIGQTLPDYTASLHTTVGLWQNAVAVTAGFQYEDGLAQQNVGSDRLAAFARGNNDPTASLAEQVAVLGVTQDFFETQTVSTLRFNSVALSYRVPTTLARRLGAQTLQLSLQGSNLALWTGYRGLDPNVNHFATGNSLQGGAILPQPRTWQVRVSATY